MSRGKEKAFGKPKISFANETINYLQQEFENLNTYVKEMESK